MGSKQPNIVHKEALTVVCLLNRGGNQQGDIAKMRQELNLREAEIDYLSEQDIGYGLMANFDQISGAYNYLACLEGTQIDGLPPGMSSLEELLDNLKDFQLFTRASVYTPSISN